MSIILDEQNTNPQPAEPDPASYILDGTTENFEAEVLQASMDSPVIVDMWAPWCGPCQQLMPILEKVVHSFKGAVRLVKINADENQEIAAALRVQSLPTVMALYKGQPIDGFMGVQPENTLRKFIENVLKTAGIDPAKDMRALLEEADKMRAQNQTEEAMALYMQALDAEQNNARAIGGLGMCFLDQHDTESAREFLKSISPELYQEEAIMNFRKVLKLKESAGSSDDLALLANKIKDNPNSHELRLELADKYFAYGNYEQAFNVLLESIALDSNWQDEAAKKKLFELFNTLGHAHPETMAARRKLSSQLFN